MRAASHPHDPAPLGSCPPSVTRLAPPLPVRIAGAASLFLACSLAAQAPAQLPNPSPWPVSNRADVGEVQPHLPGEPMYTGESALLRRRRIQTLNAMRQKSLVSDVNKILNLADRLNAELQADEANMSMAQRVHEAAEIEKLAKAVKERMAYAIGSPEDRSEPFIKSWP